MLYNSINLLAFTSGELILKTKREKSTTTKGHYVRNADLLPAVIEAKEKGVVTSKLIKMIWLIAERYSRKANFVGYSFREDMVSAAVENLCKNALKFDHVKYNNPFSFYTTAIHNSFLQFMADEKKHRNIRDALLIDAGANPSFNFMEGEKDERSLETRESDEIVFRQEKEIGPDDLPDAKPVIGTSSQTETNSEVELAKTEGQPAKKISWRQEQRAPGAVLKLSAGDFVLDPVTNTYVKKSDVVEEPVKKVRKPRVKAAVNEITQEASAVKEKATALKKKQEKAPAKKKVTEKASAKKATPAKKVAVKKTAGKTIKAPAKKAPAAKKAAKKPAVKKPAAKKTTKKVK